MCVCVCYFVHPEYWFFCSNPIPSPIGWARKGLNANPLVAYHAPIHRSKPQYKLVAVKIGGISLILQTPQLRTSGASAMGGCFPARPSLDVRLRCMQKATDLGVSKDDGSCILVIIVVIHTNDLT